MYALAIQCDVTKQLKGNVAAFSQAIEHKLFPRLIAHKVGSQRRFCFGAFGLEHQQKRVQVFGSSMVVRL
jgi:hypothetical protein